MLENYVRTEGPKLSFNGGVDLCFRTFSMLIGT